MQITVDDLVGYAMAGVERAARGRVDGGDVAFSRDAITNTPEFKRWFGDSKVVDDNGDPLVVYHGSEADFTEFHTGNRGAFFTPSNDVARTYGNPAAVYLSLKNPVVIDAKWAFWNELDAVSSPALDGLRKHGRIVVLDHIKGAAEKAGYDGAIVRNVVDNGGAGTQYIAFRPEQIKSATGNIGTLRKVEAQFQPETRQQPRRRSSSPSM